MLSVANKFTLISEKNFHESEGGEASCELIGETSTLVDLLPNLKYDLKGLLSGSPSE